MRSHQVFANLIPKFPELSCRVAHGTSSQVVESGMISYKILNAKLKDTCGSELNYKSTPITHMWIVSRKQ